MGSRFSEAMRRSRTVIMVVECPFGSGWLGFGSGPVSCRVFIDASSVWHL